MNTIQSITKASKKKLLEFVGFADVYEAKKNLNYKKADKMYKDLQKSYNKFIKDEIKASKEREKKQTEDEKLFYVSATLIVKGYFMNKDGTLRLGKKYEKIVGSSRQIKNKNIQSWINSKLNEYVEEVQQDSPYDEVEGKIINLNKVKSKKKQNELNMVMLDAGAVNLDHYVDNDLWDKKRNMCVVDYIKYRYGNIRGLIKPLKCNKKASEKESDEAIEFYSTNYVKQFYIKKDEKLIPKYNIEKACVKQSPNKTGYTIEHIKIFCSNFDINLVAFVDNEIIYSKFYNNVNHYPTFCFEMKNNHLYPIYDKKKVEYWSKKSTDKINNVKSDNQQTGSNKKNEVEKYQEIIYKPKNDNEETTEENMTKLDYAISVMEKENCYSHYPTNLTLHNDQLHSFILKNNKYVLNTQDDSEEIISYCKDKDIEYKSQTAQFFTSEYLKEFEGLNSSYLSPPVRNVLVNRQVKYRVHYGAVKEIEEEKYNESNCYDINKCYRSVMEDPIENWIFIDFTSHIEEYKKISYDYVQLGFYYVDTNDMTLLHKSNWYSSGMVNFALEENIISHDDIKFFIKGKGSEKDCLKKIINTISDDMKDYKDLCKFTINSIYGYLAKTKSTKTNLFIDENEQRIWNSSVIKNAFNNNSKFFINAHKSSIRENKTIYTYGTKYETELMSNNLPMALQILDQANIKLYKMTKHIGGELLWRKTDCILVHGGKKIEDSNIIGEYRNHVKPDITRIKLMKTERGLNLKYVKPEWNIIEENNSDEWLNIIDKFYKNKGGMILGRAGTGKSYVAIQGIDYLNKKNIKSQALAFTNKATIQLKGSTIHKFLCIDKNNKISKKWALEISKSIDIIFVDEISQISGDLWCLLCELKFMTDITFVLIGDYRQLPPVSDDEDIDWFNHDNIKYLCNNLKCELNVMKRYDVKLWDALENLWEDFNTDDFNLCFGKNKDLINNTNICYKNDTRKDINRFVNKALLPKEYIFIEKPILKKKENESELSFEKRQKKQYEQDAYVYTGLKCLMNITTKCKKFKKNEPVRICKMDKETFTISNDIDELEYKIDDFHKICLLGYATTIHKSQGDTIDGVINIFDYEFIIEWLSKIDYLLSKKALYTALSRAKNINNINIYN